ncbi:ribosomal RNA small subunit methyltransferase B [Marinobacterium nitratireducens]|uniref:16S rRNA (cytosine(967)-C(5))-methyltransferase n=1 Tax=Marinobacterium nitratireducens TaxID=518897 RepID=A0A917ZAH1_9GAMM|nr:16S rRNA (cytosine(967)-C(5))-methyltransferase RsmB [Marinobacterium nitratireducens]GGO77432.1 ribosomal RNA small subunit methyltransferase B [Marinobacterium nitratireducens]
MNLRALAAKTLAPLLQHRGSLNASLPATLAQCEPRDRALLQQLCYGTLRYEPKLSCIAEQLLKKPFRERDSDVRALVLIGLYQLDQTRVAPHAAISETVAATEALDKSWARGLVNAVLRNFQRRRDELLTALADDETFSYNHPQWLIEKLRHNWPQDWQQILAANDEPAPMTLRVNLARLSRQDYLEQLAQGGIEAHPGAHSAAAVYLAEPCDVGRLPGFAEGLASVQDEAAQLAAELLQPAPGERVLDACAAPGGKLCHLLELEPGLAAVDAVEIDAGRAERIRENLARLGLDCQLHIADAASRDWWDGQPYDRILLDAPCSASGVIRRHPDIKYLRRSEDLKTLAQLQLAILENCWAMLRPGGRLLYATCSIFPQENERVLARFLKANPAASERPLDVAWGQARPVGRQLFPQPGAQDGFYYAVLEKDREQP